MKGLSERTVRRHWMKARAYLHAAIRDDDAAGLMPEAPSWPKNPIAPGWQSASPYSTPALELPPEERARLAGGHPRVPTPEAGRDRD